MKTKNMTVSFSKCSFTSGAQIRGEEGERPPLPLFKIWKKSPDFGKEGPDCIYLCVRFSIQNVVLGVSRRKILFFFIEVPKFHETSLALKSASLRPCIPFTSLELLSTNAQNKFLGKEKYGPNFFRLLQNQLPVGALQQKISLKIWQNTQQTPVLESFF